MAIRVEQTPFIIESNSPATGHIRVIQTPLILESNTTVPGHIRVIQTPLILEITPNTLLPSVTGSFQDPFGNPIANGYLTFQLSRDAFDTTGGVKTALSSKNKVQANLDSSGNIIQPFPIYPNSVLTPTGTFYRVKLFTANGQLLWYTPIIIPNTYPSANIGNITPQF